MKAFDNSMEALIIKYTLGSAFIIVTVVFGFKIVFLLVEVAKLKVASLLGALDGTALEWIIDGIKTLSERGSVK